jgi:hypothetical protein
MASNINPKESASTAKLTFGKMSLNQITAKTDHVVGVIKQHPDYPNRPDVQACTAALEAATLAVEADVQDVHTNKASLKALLAKQAIDVAGLKRAAKQTLAVVDLASGGSAEAIKKWGFDVNGRTVMPASTDAPVGLRAMYLKGTDLVFRWNAVPGQRSYLLQMGDGSPTGWGTAMQLPKARFEPTGLTAGQKVTVRVAVMRKNGISAWSDALVATAR